MDAEGMSLNDDESLAIQEQLIAQLGAESMADLVDLYGQEMVDESVGILRVENFILENATIVENWAAGKHAGKCGGKCRRKY